MYTADTTNIQIGTYIYQKVQRQENDLRCYARVHTSVEEAPSPPPLDNNEVWRPVGGGGGGGFELNSRIPHETNRLVYLSVSCLARM